MILGRRGLFGLAGGAVVGATLPAVSDPLPAYGDQAVDPGPAPAPPVPPPLSRPYVSFFDEAGVVVARAPAARVGDSLHLRATGEIPPGVTVASAAITVDMGDGLTSRTLPQHLMGPYVFGLGGMATVDFDFSSYPALPPCLSRTTVAPEGRA